MFLLQGGWTLNEHTLPGGMNELLHFTGCVFKSVTKRVRASVYLCVVCVCLRMNVFLQMTLEWGVCVGPPPVSVWHPTSHDINLNVGK